MLAGCDRISRSEWAPNVLKRAQGLTRSAQRVFAGPGALVPEFSKADIAPVFRPNGTLRPVGMSYAEHVRTGFSDWRIPVTGLVEQPLNLSMTDLSRIGARTQITRHDCVEGWSCIGQWTGAPLRLILARARPKPNARYVVFYCADDMNGGYGNPQYYYESLDMIEALHPQTILAYGLNGKPLPIENGAPVRLRAERQLGYKMAKYVNRIELVEEFHDIRGGQGGYWEDRGYAWWAGI
jgi:DMSO/TMAO reductase YedYZ molybdopterin-dependent catalytic subunit